MSATEITGTGDALFIVCGGVITYADAGASALLGPARAMAGQADPREELAARGLAFTSRALAGNGPPAEALLVSAAPVDSAGKATKAGLERFGMALDYLPDGVTLVDRETMRFIDANAVSCRRAGLTREQYLQAPPNERADVGRREDLMRIYDGLIAGDPPVRVDEQMAMGEGGIRFPAEVTRAAALVEGRWTIVVTTRDISKRKASEARLERFRAAIDQSGDAILLIDPVTRRYLDVNDTACRMFGLTREQMLAGAVGMVPTDDPERQGPGGGDAIGRMYDRLIDAYPRLLTEEQNFYHPDGSLIQAEATRRAVPSGDGWTIISTIRDIGDRKAAQRVLERFRFAMDHIGDALTLTDRETMTYLDVNVEAARRAGMSREEYLQMRPGFRVKNASAKQLEELYDALIADSPAVRKGEYELLQAGGTYYPCEIWRTAVNIDGRWIIVTSSRDITERKRVELQLQRRMEDLTRSNEELERFAYVASHDLSEPLRMVGSYTQLLERRYKDRLDGDALDFMGYIVDGSRRMKQLIDDLLTYSRVGRSGRQRDDVAMDSVLDDALKNLEQLITDKSAVVERVPLPVIPGDRTALVQLLQNLVGNALKFSGTRQPVVRIGVQEVVKEGVESWTFSVSDNGIGIAPKYFERIFIIFQRLHAREKYDGTGIGLAVCKKIVEYHGGRIWLESQPEQGTTFHFSLPKAPPDVPAGGETAVNPSRATP